MGTTFREDISGVVGEHVWENVERNRDIAYWMNREPTDIELKNMVKLMKNKRAPGEDGFTAEVLKYGGTRLQKQVFNVVRRMWNKAKAADSGLEGAEWPKKWRIGLMVPLWKRKGIKSNKNTWRGVTFLSVGSKLLARVVAKRLQDWSEGWINENQCGFRRGRGVDDVLQVS